MKQITPEEIKKGLSVCCNPNSVCEEDCTYAGWNNYFVCRNKVMADALAYIDQLEAERDKLKRELSAAVKDIESSPKKIILDATCGTRSIWFDKHCPNAVYFDQREGVVAKKMGTKRYERTMVVDPDMIGDFRHLPFSDEAFYHVIFDPPHLHISEKAWIYNMYGSLPEDWEQLIHDGFWECMRVLKPYGTLVFKWSDLEITTRQVINAIGYEPLYGHRSGKKMNTHWMVFVKGISHKTEGNQ